MSSMWRHVRFPGHHPAEAALPSLALVWHQVRETRPHLLPLGIGQGPQRFAPPPQVPLSDQHVRLRHLQNPRPRQHLTGMAPGRASIAGHPHMLGCVGAGVTNSQLAQAGAADGGSHLLTDRPDRQGATVSRSHVIDRPGRHARRAITSGPTSSRLPSRSSRSGERASNWGSGPGTRPERRPPSTRQRLSPTSRSQQSSPRGITGASSCYHGWPEGPILGCACEG